MNDHVTVSHSINPVEEASHFFVLQAQAVALFWVIWQQQRKRKQQKQARKLVARQPSLFRQRLDWEQFVASVAGTPTFRRHIQMNFESFNKLLGSIRNRISVNEDMAVL